MQDFIDYVMTFNFYPKCNKKGLKGFKYEYYRLVFAFPKIKSFVGNGLKGSKSGTRRLSINGILVV